MSGADEIAKKATAIVTHEAKYHNLLRLVMPWVLFWLWASPATCVDPNRKISQYGHIAWRIEDGVIAPDEVISHRLKVQS